MGPAQHVGAERLRGLHGPQCRPVDGLQPSADLDALTSMLIGSFYGRYLTIAGIPDDWPDRVLSVIWPPDPSPAPAANGAAR